VVAFSDGKPVTTFPDNALNGSDPRHRALAATFQARVRAA
jgi:hypothetical protein